MKERIGALVGQAVEGMPWLGTFHSIGAKILRRHAELVGLKLRLHHPRHRRPDPPDEAADPGREHRREALAGAQCSPA
jgi:superfamily I DNA/RNA helicase